MKRMIALMCLAVLLVSSSSCIQVPKVFQGTVISYDADNKVVVAKDELPPGDEVQFSLAGADLGAEPAVGDLIRVAYKDDGGRRTATRVMNLTRQAEVGKKGSAGGGIH
ncbi:MAG: hypothetical protein AB1714_25865 [Acidobacteriota bacterium]